MFRKFIYTLLFLILQFDCVFAGTIRGSVKDNNGQPIPFALIFAKGTTMGTSANAIGEYMLNLPNGTYTLVCQNMGYQSEIYHLTIENDLSVQHHFKLQKQAHTIEEVVIKSSDEDPAYRIMRKVIKQRKKHLREMQDFQSNIYLKGVLRMRSGLDKFMGQKIEYADMGMDSSGKGVLYLVEQHADYYSQKGETPKTIIRSVKESGDPNGTGLAQLPPVICFYENNMNLFPQLSPRGFISPLAESAFNFYKYRLQGQFLSDNKIIYKIDVQPKRNFEPCYSGTIFIVDDDWALQSVDLTLHKKSGLDLLDTLRFRQEYVLTSKKNWVIKSQVSYPTINLFGFDIVGNFVTVYDNQKIGQPIPDSIARSKYVSEYLDDANKKDSTYWQSSRPIPLEQDEKRDFIYKDSVRQVYEDPARLDSMRRLGNRPSLLGTILNGYSYSFKQNKSKISLEPLLLMFNYNTVEGLNASPMLSFYSKIDTGKTISGKAAYRYGFSNRHSNGMVRLGYTHSNPKFVNRYWRVSGEAGRYVFQYNNQVIPELYNTVTTLFQQLNFLKIYEKEHYKIGFNHSTGKGLRWWMNARYENRYPLSNTTNYSWAKASKNTFSLNYPQELWGTTWEAHQAAILSIGLHFQPGYKYIKFADAVRGISGRWPEFSLTYEKGIKNILGSKSDFDKWQFGVSDELGLNLLGQFNYSLRVSGFLNDNYVSLPDLFHFNGNQFWLNRLRKNSFILMPNYRYSHKSELLGEVHLEYQLKGLLSNKIPLFKNAHWYFVVGTNSFYNAEKQFYTEIFAGVDNIGFKLFRFLRVDYVQAWDYQNRHYNGVRVGINADNFPFFSTMKSPVW